MSIPLLPYKVLCERGLQLAAFRDVVDAMRWALERSRASGPVELTARRGLLLRFDMGAVVEIEEAGRRYAELLARYTR